MSALMFHVRSLEDGNVHSLEATLTDRGLRFTCSCLEGTRGRHCHHRLDLLLGDTSDLIDADRTSLQTLFDMANGSPLMEAVQMLMIAQREEMEATEKLRKAKKILATLFMG